MNDKITYFFPKVFNRLSSEKNRIWEHLPIEKISLWGMGRVPSKEEFVGRLHKMLGEFTPEFFKDINPQDRDAILKCADQTLNHDFDLLGSGLKHFDQILWHSDFKSGYEWKKGMFYRHYNVDIDTTKHDGKVPWELSRCQHLLWLGEAYAITGNERYASEVIDEINDWIDENPLMHSVNWTCSMDVAFRAVNWMYSFAFIQHSKYLTESFICKVYRSLYQHGFFIINNLERVIPYSNNHYTSDLTGLLYIGALLNMRWYRFAKKQLINEINLQILPSGAHYERSISYHRMMTEMLSASYYLIKRMDGKVPNLIATRLQRMYDFITYYLKPSGLAPQIEDNDDGRFLPFVPRDFRNHSYLLNENSIENKLLRNGLDQLRPTGIAANTLDVGHRVTRLNDAYLLVTNGGQSRMPTLSKVVNTHTHNDLLSFEFSLGEDDIIIDPGTYQYLFTAPEGRNEYRSTRKHNTIMVDDEEQHKLSESKLFIIEKNAVIDSNDSYHLESRMHHKRVTDLKENELIIRDTVTKPGCRHNLVSRFHFAPNVKVRVDACEVSFESEHYTGQISFRPLAIFDVRKIEDSISPSYGVLEPSMTIELSLQFNDSTIVDTYISWQKK